MDTGVGGKCIKKREKHKEEGILNADVISELFGWMKKKRLVSFVTM